MGVGDTAEDQNLGRGLRALRQCVEEAIEAGAFPGAAWGVAHRGRVLSLEAAGRFTYGLDTIRLETIAAPEVSIDTRYDLASVSKVVATTAAAMLLYQKGLLALDTRLGDLLPGFVIAAECGSGRHRVTLRMLLAHASGLPGYAPLYLECADAAALLRACLQMPLTAAPGERAEYSDIGFLLLGKALEVLTGEPLDRFCAREIFAPLGMSRTGYNPSERAAIPPTERDELFRRRVVQGEVHDENCWVMGGCAGHAGLFAPAGNVLRFAEAMLAPLRDSADKGAGAHLFEAATVRLFTTRADLPPGSSRALGWDTPSEPSSSGTLFSARSAGHLGYTGTSLWIDMERDLSVVLLTNRTWPTRENQRIQKIRPDFHDRVSQLLK